MPPNRKGEERSTASDLTRIGRNSERYHGIVNPPVFRASTILHPTLEDFENREERREQPGEVVYGLNGTPTTYALEDAVAHLEGAERALALPTGLAAVTVAILACAKAGDHILVADNVYQPTRTFCNAFLGPMGVTTTFFDPGISADIATLFRDNTRLVFFESPGSLTFEVSDVPAICQAAQAAGVKVAFDNTWATPLFFRPLDVGADISIQAGTKYLAGHADVMAGMVSANGALAMRLRKLAHRLGFSISPDDCYLALRGLRTLSLRLDRHEASAMKIAQWLETRPEVARVLHPGLESHPDHELWRRDFGRSTGLFGIVLAQEYPFGALAEMVDGYALFGIGASWGGYESLVMPAHPEKLRTATAWEASQPCLRYHVGLEDPDDLIDDLAAGFDRLNAASSNDAGQGNRR